MHVETRFVFDIPALSFFCEIHVETRFVFDMPALSFFVKELSDVMPGSDFFESASSKIKPRPKTNNRKLRKI